jgi:flagellar protein FliL
MAAKPDTKPSDKNEPPAKRGKLLWIGMTVLVLLVAGLAAGWYFTRPVVEESAEEQESRKRSETVFVKLDAFTVNLADEGGERLAQVAIVLELADKESEGILAKSLPIVRNDLLLLLSSQHTRTLLTRDGKLALSREIATRSGAAMGWKPPPDDGVPPAANGSAAAGAPAAKPAAAPPKPAQSNPVVAVHFSQLLVQ